jgi:hypothetical protein
MSKSIHEQVGRRNIGSRRRRNRLTLQPEVLETRQLLSDFPVTGTADDGCRFVGRATVPVLSEPSGHFVKNRIFVPIRSVRERFINRLHHAGTTFLIV